jgi:hypothetical protein
MARNESMPQEFMPMPEDFCATITPRDRFLVSFPRSGSRWIQLLITDLVNQLHLQTPTDIYCRQTYREIWQQDKMPGTKCFTRDDVLPSATLEGRATIQRAGHSLAPIFRSHNFNQITRRQQHKIVYLFRAPVPAFVSHYHFLSESHHSAVQGVCLDEFCLTQIEPWCRHLTESIESHQCQAERIQIVRYLDHTPFDVNQLSSIASFLGLYVAPPMIDSAIRHFQRFLRELNEISGSNYRRGGNDKALSRLSRSVVKTIERRTRNIFRAASNIAANDLAAA